MVCLESECGRQWIGGARGACNNETGLCECPLGFVGKDVWQDFNSCHIRGEVITAVNLANLICTLVAILVTFGSMCYALNVLRTSGHLPFLSGGGHSNYSTALLEGGTLNDSRRNVNSALLRTRQKWMLLVLVMLFLYPVFSLPYALLNTLETPIYRYEIPWVVDLCLGISIALLYSSFWVVLYYYYKSFPDLNLITKLSYEKSPFITRPAVFERIVVFHALLEAMTVVITLGVLPAVFFGDSDTRSLLSLIFVGLSIVFVLEFTTVFVGVCLVIRRLYGVAREAVEARSSFLNVSKLDKAVRHITYMLVGVVVATCIGVVPFFVMLTTVGIRYYFVLYFICAIGGYGLAMLGSILFALDFHSSGRSLVRGSIRKGSVSEVHSRTLIHNI